MTSKSEKYILYKKKVKKYIIIDIVVLPIVIFFVNIIFKLLGFGILWLIFTFIIAIPYLIGINLTIIHIFLVFRYNTYQNYLKSVKIIVISEIIAIPLILLIYFNFRDSLSIWNILNVGSFIFWFGIIIPYTNIIINTLIHAIIIRGLKREKLE